MDITTADATTPADGERFAPPPLVAAGLGFVVILLAALLGIWSRTADLLAAFWPANALLLGMVLRWPGLNRPVLWVGAVAGYLTADLATGSELWVTVGLTGANLGGVLAGILVLRTWSAASLRLEEPRAVINLIAVCAAASGAAMLVGAPVGVAAFDLAPVTAAITWFSAEFSAYLALLPVVLAVPQTRGTGRQGDRLRRLAALVPSPGPGPVLALVPLLALGVLVGGPGALAFYLPALLWAALRGSVFDTAVLVLLTTVWNLVALGTGILEIDFGTLEAAPKVSLQVGLALMSVGPLVVAAATFAREQLLRRVRHLADVDDLTGVLNRGAWMRDAEALLAASGSAPAGVLMLDLDHFKQVNDRFGHGAGDQLLAGVGATLASIVRSGDLVGRLGGEEFAVLCVGLDPDDRPRLAERVRRAVLAVELDTAGVGPVSASGGLAVTTEARHATLEQLLTEADRLLYDAKRGGRDRILSTIMDLPGAPASP